MSVSLPDRACIAPEGIRFQSQIQQLKDRNLHAARSRAARQIAREALKRNRFFGNEAKRLASPTPSGRNQASWNRPHLNAMLSNAMPSRLLAQNYSRAPEATGFRDLQCGVEDRSVFARPTFARVAHPYMERFRYGACSVVEQIGRRHLVARHRNHRVAHRLQRISTFGVARKGARRTMECIAVVFHIEHRVGPE